MKAKTRIQDTLQRLDEALETVRQDRWQLAGLRGGKLVVIADGPLRGQRPRTSPPRVLELEELARQSLFERRAVSVSGLATLNPTGRADRWQQEWPTLLFAPVARAGMRPVGLLALGCIDSVWYEEEDIDYVMALAATVSTFVAAAIDPLRNLNRMERMTAYLLSEGLSASELARALRIERGEAQRNIEVTLRKLRLRSSSEIAELLHDRSLEIIRPITG